MTLTFSDLNTHVTHALGGGSPASITVAQIINQAGRLLHTMHDWKWAEMHPVFLRFNYTAVTGGTWTTATRTLGATGEFASLIPDVGTKINITAGTNVTTGSYAVQSRTDDDNIVLATSAGASNGTGVAFNWIDPYLALPSDFHSIVHIEATDALNRSLLMTTPGDLVRRREYQIDYDYRYYGAVVYPKKYTATSTPQSPVLAIYPTPTIAADDEDAFLLVYRRDWVDLNDNSVDTDTADVPPFMEPLLVAVTRAVAQGYEEDTVADVDSRLMKIKNGQLFLDCTRRDGGIHSDYGKMRGGWTLKDDPLDSVLWQTTSHPT